MPTCREQIISQDYADYIVEYGGIIENVYNIYQTDCVQALNERYAVFHLPVGSMTQAVNKLPYNSIPKLFGLMDSSSMDSSGITRLHNQPYLNLKGQDVIVGIIDTGIDYTHPVFINSDGSTKIVSIWDQSIESESGAQRTDQTKDNGLLDRDGQAAAMVNYGTIYTREAINEALKAEDPLAIVPSTDTDGHGTFMAGIAAGREDPANDFTGAAPRAELAIVKLKPAKTYLRQFYLIREDVPAYQENDIMAAVTWLITLARRENKPVSICVGLGTNSGNHDGDAYISRFMDMVGTLSGVSIACAAGNESNRGCHFLGRLTQGDAYEEVELRVGEGERGFSLELWGVAPDIFSVGFVSPGGEVINRISPRMAEVQRFTFFLEPTEILINHRIVESVSGGQVILMRFVDPVPGIWRIRVYGSNLLRGQFHMWLPIHGFVSEDTFFLAPQPDTTVTAPADAWVTLSVGAYNHLNDSIYLYSGRGFTPSGTVVPDFCAPGVNIFGPGLRGRFTTRSGTSVAAAHACGAAALMLQWGIYGSGDYFMSTMQIRQYFIRGARRKDDIIYPSRIWGYGTLDVYHAFEIFIT